MGKYKGFHGAGMNTNKNMNSVIKQAQKMQEEMEKVQEELEQKNYLASVVPHDIVKFGLIPELVGRLPVIVSLDALDENALTRILVEPKNALIKQYKALIGMDNVELEFEPDAIKAIASLAIERKTGARGLRAIMEEIMLDIMYEIPSRDDVAKVIITADSVNKKEQPKIITKPLPKEVLEASTESAS